MEVKVVAKEGASQTATYVVLYVAWLDLDAHHDQH